jgi:cytochrome c oxidase subunit IV
MTNEHGHGGHAGPSYRAYMVVAGALAIFTSISFIVNSFVRDHVIESHIGFTIILGVAVCKALLVGAFFMHLRWEWGKLYFMIVPAFILGTMMMMVLMPDIVISWLRESQDAPAVQNVEQMHHELHHQD